jgi:hypothetical protein
MKITRPTKVEKPKKIDMPLTLGHQPNDLIDQLASSKEKIRDIEQINKIIDNTTSGSTNKLAKQLLFSHNLFQENTLTDEISLAFFNELKLLNRIIKFTKITKTNNNTLATVKDIDLYLLTALQFNANNFAKKLLEFGASPDYAKKHGYSLDQNFDSKELLLESKEVKALLDNLIDRLTPEDTVIKTNQEIMNVIDSTTTGPINTITKMLLHTIIKYTETPVKKFPLPKLSDSVFDIFTEILIELNIIVSVAEEDKANNYELTKQNPLDLYFLVALQFRNDDLAKKLLELGANPNYAKENNFSLDANPTCGPNKNFCLINNFLSNNETTDKSNLSDVLPGGENFVPKDEE